MNYFTLRGKKCVLKLLTIFLRNILVEDNTFITLKMPAAYENWIFINDKNVIGRHEDLDNYGVMMNTTIKHFNRDNISIISVQAILHILR